MKVPTCLIPRCPKCGRPMTVNLRCDDTFVQDEGWYTAQGLYKDFLLCHQGGRVVYFELGVGMNTPVIIKYPFWKLTAKNHNAIYVCINFGETVCPQDIRPQSICLDSDIGTILKNLKVSSAHILGECSNIDKGCVTVEWDKPDSFASRYSVQPRSSIISLIRPWASTIPPTHLYLL